MSKLVQTSKFLSSVLRHQPQAVGLALDAEGWSSVDDLTSWRGPAGAAVLTPAQRAGRCHERQEALRALERRPAHPRRPGPLDARREPSVRVAAAARRALPRHGVALVAAISQESLKPGSRHYVHLSTDEGSARAVGLRYGLPVVLVVDAARMHARGYFFY